MKEAQERRLLDLKERAEDAKKPLPEHASIDRRAWLLSKSVDRLNYYQSFLDRGHEEIKK